MLLVSLLAAVSIADATPKLTTPDAATHWQQRDVAVAHAPAAASAAANRETKMPTTTLSTSHKCESDSSGWHAVAEDHVQVDTRSTMNVTGMLQAKGSPHRLSASLRLLGELLASAFARTLHSYGRSIPDTLIVPTAADGSWCAPPPESRRDVAKSHQRGVLLTALWPVRKVSPPMAGWCGWDGGEQQDWSLCYPTRNETGYESCKLLPCSPHAQAAFAALFCFDFLLFNLNRFKGKRSYGNLFARLDGCCPHRRAAGDSGPPGLNDFDGNSLTLAFIDNEFAAHVPLEPLGGPVCTGFPDYDRIGGLAGFVEDVVRPPKRSSNGELENRKRGTVLAARCPVGPALLGELAAYRRGTDFSAAVVAALGPRRALIAQGRWRQLFKEPGCPDLAAYLAARYDSLMVGLRRWGCELATVDGIPALNAYGHRVQLETTDVHAANLASPAEKKDMWTRASTPLAEKLQRLDAWLASLSTK